MSLPPDDNEPLTGNAPADKKSLLVDALMALRRQPTASLEDIDFYAELLGNMAWGGQHLHDQVLKRPSQGQVKAELDRLRGACESLSKVLDALHDATREDLWVCSAPDLDDLKNTLNLLSAKAKELEEVLLGEYRSSGRLRDLRAIVVVAAADEAFRVVTGRTPTFTTDPQSSKISGEWPEFVERVFAALGIKGSARRRARSFVQTEILQNLDIEPEH
ncbi:hypothetical protein [Aestuariicoccus sp. MJ-SS9]|uniref:hypothetical protein n=1 Tax=Aestuariicoccus sp. MJ-SS9 TaxID=3079855 RepID=UPI00290EFE59|nr:hypothetical protein [Aestuariicoccus sp. MJ-SS9]MDU8911680.1 hypothetical protein [Aestuariicoccus sp. MJ-SS9]